MNKPVKKKDEGKNCSNNKEAENTHVFYAYNTYSCMYGMHVFVFVFVFNNMKINVCEAYLNES